MILHWDNFSRYYSDGFNHLNQYRSKFEAAGQTTFALLCCHYAPAGHLLKPSTSNHVHAEQNLLQTEMWTKQIPQALEEWNQFNDKMIVTMVVNRSPCQICAPLLVKALNHLHAQFPLRCEQNRFILAFRGVYEDKNFTHYTTITDLRRLKEAGWELCVLQMGPTLSNRGQMLLEGLKNIGGWGVTRLG